MIDPDDDEIQNPRSPWVIAILVVVFAILAVYILLTNMSAL